MKLSSQDKKDLDKYTKFLALKTTQIIIQSRIGEKISTPCNPNSQGTDWFVSQFNLHINDLPEILQATKKALNGDIIQTYIPLCVEISLKTPEGDQMVLECWCLSLMPEACDPNVRIIHNVYNRMGILLKSLVSVTRVTPAYKLSRRQGPDSYVICYRVFVDQPQLHSLGDGFKQVRIGQICTPIGTLQMSLAYRTKMTISPTQTGKNSIMVKSDHFNANSNTRRHRNSDDINDLTKLMRPGPFADAHPKKSVDPQLPGVERLLSLVKNKSRPGLKPEPEEPENDISSLTSEEQLRATESSEKENSPTPSEKMSASRMSTASFLKSIGEEHWMKEVSAPFADGGPWRELMQFYKQCKKSPPLQSPSKNPSPEEITQMLERFELQLPEYEAVVQSFCESPDNN